MFKIRTILYMLKKSLIIWANTKCHIINKVKKMVSNIFKVTTKWIMISTSTPYET